MTRLFMPLSFGSIATVSRYPRWVGFPSNSCRHAAIRERQRSATSRHFVGPRPSVYQHSDILRSDQDDEFVSAAIAQCINSKFRFAKSS